MIVATALDAAKLIAPLYAGIAREKLVVLHLDGERRLISIDEHDEAGSDETLLPLREIFKTALNQEALGLVVAHNHPSGDPRPSRMDIEMTRRLAETADALGIRLHDHLIFAGGEWRSFRELGLL